MNLFKNKNLVVFFFKNFSRNYFFYFFFGLFLTPILFLTVPDSICQSDCEILIFIARNKIQNRLSKPKIKGNVVNDIESFKWYKPELDSKIKTLKDLNTFRSNYINYVVDKTSYKVTKNKFWNDNEYKDFKNLSHIDKINFIHKNGVNSHTYYFVPKKSNNKLIIFHEGHYGNFKISKETLNYFNRKGYHVIAYQMPLLGTNPGILNSRNEIQKHHEVLIKFETSEKSFISLFVSPIILGIDSLTKENKFESISMVGISGGGWTTVLSSAADKRINYSFPISGSLPLSLRSYDIGDIEQYHLPFYKKYSYLDLYILGSSELSRGQVQMTISNDTCCFSGSRPELYKDYIDNISRKFDGVFLTNYVDGYQHKVFKSQYKFIHKTIESWDNN